MGSSVISGQSGPYDLDFAEQHTINHHNCPACMAADEALQAKDENVAEMLFPDAGAWWMRLRKQSATLKAAAHEATQCRINAMAKFFGGLRLIDIRPGHIRQYQIARIQNKLRVEGKEITPWKVKASHSCINHEICVMAQILRHCKLWHAIRPFYFPLHIEEWSPREILSEVEEKQFFAVASKHPEAALAYWVALITNNTSASGMELRGLQLKHLLLHSEGVSKIYIPASCVKNDSRPRSIPLIPTALWAVEQVYKRALQLGCCEDDHYLFPFRIRRNEYDPTRQASKTFLRKSWAKLRKVTGFPALSPHHLRHHCITKMLEAGAEAETVTAIAGHRPNSKMLEYYSHHRTRVKYDALMTLEKHPAQGPQPVPALRAAR